MGAQARATESDPARERKRRAPLPAGCVVAACSFGFGQKNLTFGLELLLFNVAAAKNKEKPTTTKLHMACIAKFAERARMYICMCVCECAQARQLQRRRVLSTMQANGSKANGEGNSFWDF